MPLNNEMIIYICENILICQQKNNMQILHHINSIIISGLFNSKILQIKFTLIF